MKMKKLITIALSAVLLTTTSCQENTPKKSKKINIAKPKAVVNLKYSVDRIIPHSKNSFTEGLLIHNNQIFESTGSPDNLPFTKSVYGTVDTTNGEINIKNQLAPSYFGEGICILNNQVFQLTYQSREGFVYDLDSHKKIKSFQIPTKEGWGLTTDGENLIMTDGSANLHFIDPVTLEKTGTLKVFDTGRPVMYLNEIEYVNGYIYANIYTTDWIVKIDAESGRVIARIDVTDLKLEEDRNSNTALETNGIAYNTETNQLYITGKMWQNIYCVSVFE